jgi:hypothetical protein
LPLIGPAAHLVLFIAVSFFDLAGEFVVIAFDLKQVVICELTPLLLEFTFKLLPLPFELIVVHYNILLVLYRRAGVASWHQCPLQSGWMHLHWPVGGSAFRHWSLQNSLPAGA